MNWFSKYHMNKKTCTEIAPLPGCSVGAKLASQWSPKVVIFKIGTWFSTTLIYLGNMIYPTRNQNVLLEIRMSN